MLAKHPAVVHDRDSPRRSSRIRAVDVMSGALWPVAHTDRLVLASEHAPWQDSLLVEQHRQPPFEGQNMPHTPIAFPSASARPASWTGGSPGNGHGANSSPPVKRMSFRRLFKQSTGLSPHRYLLRQRIKCAKQLLADPQQGIAAVSQEVGFAHQSHFTRLFHRWVGLTPRQYRQRHRR
jgi:Helix-turn-helix domain